MKKTEDKKGIKAKKSILSKNNIQKPKNQKTLKSKIVNKVIKNNSNIENISSLDSSKNPQNMHEENSKNIDTIDTKDKNNDLSDHSHPPGIIAWIDYRLPIFSFLKHFAEYKTPKNLNYLWNLGSIAGIALVIQIITGVFLAMHYDPDTDGAFNSVEKIMRSVNYGWLIRYIHAVGASMFFVVVYIHIMRGLYYGSYKKPRELLWQIGVVIFIIMMATAFMGYVLPWGDELLGCNGYNKFIFCDTIFWRIDSYLALGRLFC
jgi:hypothetical protein